MREQGLDNIRIVRHDAVEVFEQGLAPGSVDEILVFFPDPWPKARHHRRRIIQPDVVQILVARARDRRASCASPPTGSRTPST